MRCSIPSDAEDYALRSCPSMGGSKLSGTHQVGASMATHDSCPVRVGIKGGVLWLAANCRGIEQYLQGLQHQFSAPVCHPGASPSTGADTKLTEKARPESARC